MQRPSPLRALLCTALLAVAAGCGGDSPGDPPGAPDSGAPPTENPMPSNSGTGSAFVAEARYVDDRGAPFGTRWVHADNGLAVTVLHIQSVPQVFLYVNTPPVSDRGEPHTGEHLLLGKGAKGKLLSAAEGKSLVGSTAWTSQSDVVYAWNCAAGKETFYQSVARYLDALLLPDYTDEEVRREVMNLGVARDAETGVLSLEEKGTIYNEMVSTYERRWNVWRGFQVRLWGADHPLSWSSGGEPAAVREMEPHHIHEFHRDHYHLSANMGMIVALPDTVPEAEFLDRLASIVADLEKEPALAAREKKLHEIPAARPQEDRSLVLVPYPNTNEEDVGAALVAWPPVASGSQRDHVLAQTLAATLAEGETATLYKRLMDSATREVDVDASEMFGWVETTKVDEAFFLGFDGFPRRNATEDVVGRICEVYRSEFERVAGLDEGSDALAEFNRKALVKLTEWKKNVRKELNSPPLFGKRGAGGFWLDHLRLVDRSGAPERSVTLAPVFAQLRAELADGKNPWKGVVERFGLLESPYVSISVPSKSDLERREREKAERVAVYAEELKERYGAADAQAAIASYDEEYAAASAELDARDATLPSPRLVDDLPRNSDPSIRYEALAGWGVRAARGRFESMTFVEASLAFDLHGVAREHYPWLAVLPQILTGSGVVLDGRPLPYDEAQSRRSEEIYSLSADYALRPARGRHELRVTAMGADLDEARRSVDWIEACVVHPWTAPENLPRLRDLVAQAIRQTRGTLGGREEGWVNNPASALAYQHDELFLATFSHHTQLFELARAEWRLTEPAPAEHAAAVNAFLDALPGLAGKDAQATVAAIRERAAGAGAAAEWIDPLARRVESLVADLAPGSLARDLAQIGRVAAADVALPPQEALRQIDAVRAALLHRPRCRLVLTGSSANTDALRPRLEALFATFGDEARAAAPAPRPGVVATRLRDHEGAGPAPVHHALVHGGGSSGVFLNRAHAAGYDDLDEDTLIRELAGRVFGGAGPHGFFMQTWGAGLAYSNGLGVRPSAERANYYAERCPDLVQTMKFVTGLVGAADELDGAALPEYTISLAVTYSRESERYEVRTRSLADEIEDGDTPERVERYRNAVLALRSRADLWEAMRPHVGPAAGRVLPGIPPNSRDVPGGQYLVIAPERLIAGWEEWVAESEGADERVYRVHPRDFWLVPAP